MSSQFEHLLRKQDRYNKALAEEIEQFGRRYFVDDNAKELPRSPKQDVLLEALQIVTGPRQQLYGHPSQNFIDTAEIMSAYLHARGLLPRNVWLEAYDVPILIDCLKTARIATSPQEKDHWVDKAGYAGCGYEAAVDATSDSETLLCGAVLRHPGPIPDERCTWPANHEPASVHSWNAGD